MEQRGLENISTVLSRAVASQPAPEPIKLEPLPNPDFRDYSAEPTISRGIFPDVESSFHLIERLSDGRWLCAREDGFIEIRSQDSGELTELVKGTILENQLNPARIKMVKECQDHVLMVDQSNSILVWQKKPGFRVLKSLPLNSTITDIMVHQNQIVCLCEGGKLVYLNPNDSESKTINFENCKTAGLYLTPDNQLALMKRVGNNYQLHLVQEVDQTSATLEDIGPSITCAPISPILRLSYNQMSKHLTCIISKVYDGSAFVFGVSVSRPVQEGSVRYLTKYKDFDPAYETTTEEKLNKRKLTCAVTQEGQVLMFETINKWQKFDQAVTLHFDYYDFPKLKATPQKNPRDDYDRKPFFTK